MDLRLRAVAAPGRRVRVKALRVTPMLTVTSAGGAGYTGVSAAIALFAPVLRGFPTNHRAPRGCSGGGSCGPFRHIYPSSRIAPLAAAGVPAAASAVQISFFMAIG